PSDYTGALGRCLLRRRERAGREGSGENPRLHPRGPRFAGRLLAGRIGLMNIQQPNSFRTGPDERGHFGIYGGRFVAETLMPLILDLERAYAEARKDPVFKQQMDGYLKNYVGRPSSLYFAERLTAH